MGLFNRIWHFRRTIWQLRTLWNCGLTNHRLAQEVITSGECLQRKWELLAMMAMVKDLKPEVVVEIGTYRGGTLRCWSSVCPTNTQFISIDLPGGDFGGGYRPEDVPTFRSRLKGGQTLHCLLANSQEAGTKQQLMEQVGTRPIDFLFIDGDHSYQGVKNDYECYGPLVRPGGLIALHDIMPHKVHQNCRVHEFWAELKQRQQVIELVDRDGFENWGGIGVVTVAPVAQAAIQGGLREPR